MQQSFDTLLGPGNLSATADCVNDGADAAWTTDSSYAGATIVLELAGNAGSNRFGVYDLNDPTRRREIFQGNDNAGSTALIQLTGAPGAYTLRITEDGNVRTLSLADSAFGFYLLGANGPLFSDSSQNPDGIDYLYAYRGAGDVFIGGPNSVAQTEFRSSDYLLAWEDLRNGDFDYQDFVVLTRNVVPVTPVPLPSAAWLLISGLVGLVGVARTRTNA